MVEQLELFNMLTITLLIGGIMLAGIALFIFLHSGLREYYFLKRHTSGKALKKSNRRKEKTEYLEDRSIESFLEMKKTSNPSKSEENEEKKQRIVTSSDEETDVLREGCDRTEDLGKPSAIQRNKYEEDEDMLTGVLNDDTAETDVLDEGNEDTLVLNTYQSRNVRKNANEDNALWNMSLTNNEIVETYDIVIVNTDRKVDVLPKKKGEE